MIYRYGDQYHRCNNVTNSQCSVYNFITTQYLLFKMNTLMNALCNCIKLSGYGKDDDDGNKEMNHVNLFSKSHESKAVLFLESQVSKKLTISDSV